MREITMESCSKSFHCQKLVSYTLQFCRIWLVSYTQAQYGLCMENLTYKMQSIVLIFLKTESWKLNIF